MSVRGRIAQLTGSDDEDSVMLQKYDVDVDWVLRKLEKLAEGEIKCTLYSRMGRNEELD